MLTQVIKSNGEVISFNAKKIIGAITRAAKDAKLSPEEINKVVKEVADRVIVYAETKEEIESNEIREMILSELDVLAPKVSFEWRKFMNTHKK